MKLTSIATVAVTSLLATATAFAQPGPDQEADAEPAPQQMPPPQQQPAPYYGAPMTYAWSNVSHINGTLVPVGEHNQYLVQQQRKVNIAVNPLGWMFGFYGISGSYAVSNNIAIRADVNFFDFDGEQGYEYGLSAPIYFKRTYSGPFLEPGIIARGFQREMDTAYNCIDCGGYDDGSDDAFFGPEVLFGYHSTFDSGLNVAAAIGAARNLDSQHSSDDVQPAGYFRVGYAF